MASRTNPRNGVTPEPPATNQVFCPEDQTRAETGPSGNPNHLCPRVGPIHHAGPILPSRFTVTSKPRSSAQELRNRHGGTSVCGTHDTVMNCPVLKSPDQATVGPLQPYGLHAVRKFKLRGLQLASRQLPWPWCFKNGCRRFDGAVISRENDPRRKESDSPDAGSAAWRWFKTDDDLPRSGHASSRAARSTALGSRCRALICACRSRYSCVPLLVSRPHHFQASAKFSILLNQWEVAERRGRQK